MAKASKLVKVSKFLKSEGFEVSATELAEYTSLTAKRGGCEVFIMSHESSKYFTVRFTLNGEVVRFTTDEAIEGFGICKTQNDVIRDVTALISKAEVMQQIKIEEKEAEVYEAQSEEIVIVETEGRELFKTVKKAFPGLSVVNPFTSINAESSELTNYNFDIIKCVKHTATVRVYANETRLITFSKDHVDVQHFSHNQQYELLQAIEKHFPILTPEQLEEDGFEVTQNPDEAIYVTPEGVLIGGEFDYGSRGVDHRCISCLVPGIQPYENHTAFWNYVHEELRLVRLVPETKTALIGFKQALTKIQREFIEKTGYEVEEY